MLSRTEVITRTAVFTTVGLILSYIETFIVIPVNVPGVRIGLANIATLLALYLLGPGNALAVTALRVSMASILFGSPVSFVYSIAGGICALIVMIPAKRLGFSVYGVSVTGAVIHNIAQTVVALVFVSHVYLLTVLPPLIVAGIVSGLLTGLVSDLIIKRLSDMERPDKRREDDRLS